MKLLLLCSPDANQRALAHRLAEHVQIDAIILCKQEPGANSSLPRMAGRLMRGLIGLPLRKAWFGMLDHYGRAFPDFPIGPALTVTDINDPAVFDAVRSIQPTLTIVSGTNLLKQALIETIQQSGKLINLHTGISPYVRGGPNCTNWCLATGQFGLIGNTVMWIDAGIDSGNLIATEQTPLDGAESLTDLHVKVMDHAHDLLVRCVRLLANRAHLPNVPQRDLGNGRLFLTRHWNALAAARAVANFHVRYRSARRNRPRLVNLREAPPS
jgi:methionyl-tRNA formyltransferase